VPTHAEYVLQIIQLSYHLKHVLGWVGT
jgi:hypothetical protein